MTDTTNHPHNALPIGHQIQDYIIQSVLGDGGFGITYLAKDTQLNALVAIKEYLPNELAVRDQEHTVHAKSQKEVDVFNWGLKRFLDEARVLAQFKHPNIIRVLRFFSAHNTAYIVMEYEQGQSLTESTQEGQSTTEEKLMQLLPPLLDALETVHDAGYLHRDIKPDNIYLREEDNSPVLLDFGAARFEVGRRSCSVTSIVTPGYAPFEQYEGDGRQQGPWTDIYALGAVLYYMIWGIKPVVATKRISAIMRDNPDPLRLAVEIGHGHYSESFLHAIDLALAIQQEDRPQNVSAWRAQLFSSSPIPSLSLKNTSIGKRSSTKTFRNRHKRVRFKWYYGIALLLVLVVIGRYGWLDYVEKNEPSHPISITQQTTLPTFLERRQQIEAETRQLDAAIQQEYISIAQRDAIEIGKKIWMNESSGKLSGLTSWNKQENFASMGIGHFIWYPQEEGPFTETFPDLLIFMREQGVILPDWLQTIPSCPWQTRQAFLNNQQSEKMVSLRTLMKNTVPLQVQFMIRRLELALPKILESLPTKTQQALVRDQFYRVAQTPKGVYALLDYVHFKGEGTSPTERYHDQGWGLLQVLEYMPGNLIHATDEFVDAAEFVLKRRIENSTPARNEARWFAGWKNRLNTYR